METRSEVERRSEVGRVLRGRRAGPRWVEGVRDGKGVQDGWRGSGAERGPRWREGSETERRSEVGRGVRGGEEVRDSERGSRVGRGGPRWVEGVRDGEGIQGG